MMEMMLFYYQVSCHNKYNNRYYVKIFPGIRSSSVERATCEPDKAIDGLLSPDGYNMFCSGEDDSPWLELELEYERWIAGVVIVNRNGKHAKCNTKKAALLTALNIKLTLLIYLNKYTKPEKAKPIVQATVQ